jgi:hypothetical protein
MSYQLNISQQIFLVFFAIFWGVSANAWPKRKPFHWAFVNRVRVALRAALSVAMLNVIPVWFFVCALRGLGGDQKSLDWPEIVAGVVPAFFTFGIYRLWLAFIEIRPETFYYEVLTKDMKRDDPADEPVEMTIKELHPKRRPAMNLMFSALYIFIAITPFLCGFGGAHQMFF